MKLQYLYSIEGREKVNRLEYFEYIVSRIYINILGYCKREIYKRTKVIVVTGWTIVEPSDPTTLPTANVVQGSWGRLLLIWQILCNVLVQRKRYPRNDPRAQSKISPRNNTNSEKDAQKMILVQRIGWSKKRPTHREEDAKETTHTKRKKCQ